VEEAFAQCGDQIAAVILEPYPANAGFVMPMPGYLQLLRDLTAKHGALLIFDEVMTGFRLAQGGVQELVGITPDLCAMGKVIGGGLPVGAFGGRADIMDWLAPDGPVYQAGTLSGNPIAMATGLAQLRELDKVGGFRRLDQIGQRFEAGLRGLLAAKGLPYRLNRVGSMWCLFFGDAEIVNVDSVKQGDFAAFRKFFWACLERGVYIAPSPYETGFISLAHSDGDIDDTLEVFGEALASI
jgi:glutamate-1-semialdehyde 2,1-aminomutase